MSSKEHAVHRQEEEAAVFKTKEGKKLFHLPRRVTSTLRRCRESESCRAVSQEAVKYLWAAFRADDGESLDADGWMNVVDEAASLGLTFIVFSLEGPLSANPSVIKVAGWAQEAYGITVGIHTEQTSFTNEEVEALLQLDCEKLRLYSPRDNLDHVRHLETKGIRVAPADPRGTRANPEPCCELPRKMLFVDRHGTMYTCKYVKDNENFHVGHVCERTFKDVVADPKRPSSVPQDVPFIEHGCDGCPPILDDEES